MKKFIINVFADEAAPELIGQIAAMKRNGVSGLEIRNVDGKNIADIPLNEIKEIGKALESEGLKVWSIGSRLGKIKITDGFDKHLDEFKYTLDIAHTLNAKHIRLFSFYIPNGEKPETFRDEVFERTSKFLEIAEDSGILLCHENEKGIYGDIAPRCLELHEAFPALGCIFDPANFIQCGQNTLEAWELLGKYVTYMHIKDALPDGRVVPAGKGDGHLNELLEKFSVCGGNGVTVEPHLSVFKGLEGLEREGEKSLIDEFKYPSKDAAFDAAVDALKSIIM